MPDIIESKQNGLTFVFDPKGPVFNGHAMNGLLNTDNGDLMKVSRGGSSGKTFGVPSNYNVDGNDGAPGSKRNKKKDIESIKEHFDL